MSHGLLDWLMIHKFFIHGVLAFGISHIIYATAYGMRPLRLLMIPFMLAPVILSWAMFSSVLYKPLSYVIYLYILLTMIMIWRAIARLKFDDKEWTWTRFYSFLGGLLFATSDLLLALDRFVTPLPGSQILIMATYYSAQLLITLSVVDSREDIEINHCVIQETDIIKVLQEQGKLLSQVHKDDILAILTTKRQLIHNTFANTQLLTLLMEKKIQLGANIDSLLNKTNILLFVNQHEQQKPKKNTHRHRRRTKRDQQNSDTMSSRTNSSSDTDNESKRIKISADEILIKRKHTINTALRKYSSGLNYYWHILLDEDSLYVGAQNLLLRLNRDNIEDRSSPLYKSVDIPSKRDEVQKCLSHSLNQAFDCENHVRVLLRRKTKYNDLFVCSTNAFSPKIYYFNPDLTEKLPAKEGFGYCSRDPRHINTALWSDNGNPSSYGFIYSGAVMDYTKTEPIIYRPPSDDGTIKYMRTPQYDIDWLSAPEFIDSFDIGSYIYFFFREKAEEQKSYEPALSHIYSRVGRVCKNDIGSAPIMANYWTSFRKARIICMSGTSDTPYVFNDISKYSSQRLRLSEEGKDTAPCF
ncbi:unnamed protein product [Didymodactylos carnosus]|uniref:lysoplasmalogenase n=2 Tax=Didymodactylos carnosus TaxID=1234261 RepID=A0A813RS77_9BILA|nr:unnamed protein product [Didymodactylos carnosus]CAF3569801.1 unnamed protein product [Didymodactylos carnosus]